MASFLKPKLKLKGQAAEMDLSFFVLNPPLPLLPFFFLFFSFCLWLPSLKNFSNFLHFLLLFSFFSFLCSLFLSLSYSLSFIVFDSALVSVFNPPQLSGADLLFCYSFLIDHTFLVLWNSILLPIFSSCDLFQLSWSSSPCFCLLSCDLSCVLPLPSFFLVFIICLLRSSLTAYALFFLPDAQEQSDKCMCSVPMLQQTVWVERGLLGTCNSDRSWLGTRSLKK